MKQPTYARAIFLFRRDLRLEDNLGLCEALASADEVLACFVADPRQLLAERNPYLSCHAVQFMLDSLRELDEELRREDGALHVLSGESERAIERFIELSGAQALFCNADYTPFSQRRDSGLRSSCEREGIGFHSFDDALLREPREVLKPDGAPYSVFTPYFKRWQSRGPAEPRRRASGGRFGRISPAADRSLSDEDFGLVQRNPRLAARGGRKEALRALERVRGLADYEISRNDLVDENGTSRLSSHLKFGTLSAREAYGRVSDLFGRSHALIRELAWRDFFTQIAFHFPRVFGGCFREAYDGIEWSGDPAGLERWEEGSTGFPIVDAAMRELAATGYMRNRARMIAASFLVKDLRLDWRLGERYFARKLADYDPCVNNGNWQWAASTGCDAQPYFRIFNPWTQQERFDPECAYVKRWIPELAPFEPRQIHALRDSNAGLGRYPAPMLDHRLAVQEALEMFEAVRER